MEKYKILCELIRKEQFGENITKEEKSETVSVFLSGRNSPAEIAQYKKRMRVNPNGDCLYPDYYLPPYHNGKKLRLVQGYLPKTNLLYANHYEAEILRLLVQFVPDHETVKDMVCHTLKRFEKTCFGTPIHRENVLPQAFVFYGGQVLGDPCEGFLRAVFKVQKFCLCPVPYCGIPGVQQPGDGIVVHVKAGKIPTYSLLLSPCGSEFKT